MGAPLSDLTGAPSARARVRRKADRARYGRDDVLDVLDAGLIAHVGVATPEGPLALPMAYGHNGERLRLHGAEASARMRTGDPVDEPDDIAGPWRAGVVPVTTRFGAPTASAGLAVGDEPPAAIAAPAGLTSEARPGLGAPRVAG